MLSDITKMWTKLIVLACLVAVSQARFINVKRPLISGRVVGGVDALPGEFPHQVSIQVYEGSKMHLCAGSIIDEQWILTAADCMPVMSDLSGVVKAGKLNLSATEPTEQESQMKTCIIHENYTEVSPALYAYDVALVKLATPLRFNKHVAPISLPAKGSEPTGTVIASGWGAFVDDDEENAVFDVLQKANLKILDRAICRKAFVAAAAAEGLEAIEGLVDESDICTGPLSSGGATCNNDLGGPLISKGANGKSELVGVASWLRPCGKKGYPSVYVKVSSIIDWIHDTISQN